MMRTRVPSDFPTFHHAAPFADLVIDGRYADAVTGQLFWVVAKDAARGVVTLVPEVEDNVSGGAGSAEAVPLATIIGREYALASPVS